ncbi:FAD-binding and (Fe-S)-binding domain-containing protein [Acidiferrimicrobium sp. IK]|uniref:FAD-binding and (Fe-S)-binding domain-containing protein n=1 Tax=Acidiferrimicrobium sp. IK TaxID=2871700 RepID=UPI0039672991
MAVGMVGVETIDVDGLRRALTETVEGEVRFDAGSIAMYANDASNFRQVPLGVVVPKTLDDVVAAHRACARFGAPVLNRGGGTSLSGETVNYAVVIDNSKYLTRIGETDVRRRTVTVEPGAINEQVNVHTGRQGLVFGPAPSSHSRCTIGGNIGNNSCGIHSVQAQLYGPGPRTSDNVAGLEVCTYDGERFWVGVDEEAELDQIIAAGGRKGEIYAKLRDLRDRYADAIRAGYPDVSQLPRRVSGYNLDELLPEKGFNVARALVGTEGTCATALQATLMLTPAMLERTLVVVGYPDICEAATHVEEIIGRFRPIGLEAVDDMLINDQQELGMNVEDLEELPQPAKAWLLVQFGADDAEESQSSAQAFVDWLHSHGYKPDRVTVMASKQEGGRSEDIWTIRESGLGSTAFPPDGRDHWPGWEDSAVPPSRAGAYLRDLKALYDRHGLRGAFYGHLGQGCIHSRISFDLRSPEGVRDYRAFMEEAADLVVSYGGTLSGEHGDGQQRAELLEKQYGPELMAAMREFKLIWDPRWRMNPGKVVDAFRLDEDLKLGTGYNPHRSPTKFAYKQDGGDFAHAALRCVGVGKCRVPQAKETMCPSYQVTREEKHSTRGRARLLFEMLRGEVITDGWQSEEVFDALDLCLACKGCTNDCPVNVDMPTYKAEFLYHHYQSWRRRRPRYAYAFGFIDQASRLASRVPELVNFATQTPVLAAAARLAAGIDRRRPLPTFAPMTLQEWFARRGGTANPHGRPVVVFPDTFNNHLHTQVGVACVEAIEAAGWQVIVPEGHLCCGRPLYDYGFLDTAERYLHNVLDRLRPYVRDGIPVVGMEPSCLAVFRDELTKILPHDNDAARLAEHALHFGEFFERYELDVPHLEGKALLWGHCHHRATGGVDPEQKTLERMGLEVQSLSGGCCGLAGSWGFEEGKYDMSLECGEQALLPAVRDAKHQTVVVANGFSCKTQIEDAGTGRRALHLAEVMRLAASPGPGGGARADGDRAVEDSLDSTRPAPGVARRAGRTASALVGGLAAVAWTSLLLRRLVRGQ